MGSKPLFEEYERKVRDVGSRLKPGLREQDAPLLRRQMQAICVAAAPPFDPTRVPALTRDPSDDPIVYGALLAASDLLVSGDKHIVPNRESQEYEHGEDRLLAVTFSYLVSEIIPHIDWDGVDGELLVETFSATNPELPPGVPT
ncbi:MAG TPA: hypothetical protein VIH92_13960 [Solirubrobacteraceae bacterium]